MGDHTPRPKSTVWIFFVKYIFILTYFACFNQFPELIQSKLEFHFYRQIFYLFLISFMLEKLVLKGFWQESRVSNMVTGNPRTREKTMWKQAQGMGGLRFWDFQVYRTGTRSFFSHMVFLGKFLADPKTQKCHFNNQNVCWAC